MKNFDSRIYSIADFMEWDRNHQLELNPRFQRRSVWSENAKSYLMDSIVRGRPIPKIFIRQKLSPTTQIALKEVVDGQQRLRAILSYLKDGFVIMKKHNADYGGLYFSQLDEDTQSNILNYEISVDLLINVSDVEVLDIFGRLNSYAYNLNEQERINSNHFGPFKTLADRIGHKYYGFWVQNGILTDAQVLRMGDVTLVADMLIATIEGIKSKKQIKSFYDQYEGSFPHDNEALEQSFDLTMKIISDLLGESFRTGEFQRIHIFYTLFTSVFHLQYGLKGMDLPREPLTPARYPRVRTALEGVEAIFQAEDVRELQRDEAQFLQDSRRATTDAKVRARRTEFMVSRMLSS
jgi:hypothetical protein